MAQSWGEKLEWLWVDATAGHSVGYLGLTLESWRDDYWVDVSAHSKTAHWVERRAVKMAYCWEDNLAWCWAALLAAQKDVRLARWLAVLLVDWLVDWLVAQWENRWDEQRVEQWVERKDKKSVMRWDNCLVVRLTGMLVVKMAERLGDCWAD
jgi:hypothetical protein